MTKVFNFTKASIQSLKAPSKGTEVYKDTKEKGLQLYITSTGVISFFVRKRIDGKDERVILGSFPDMTVENARKKATIAKAKISEGTHPLEHKHKMQKEATFKDLFKDYMERYSKPHKRSWQYDEREVNKFLSHWLNRKISTISQYEIQQLHNKIKDENGLYQANRILERIRAIFNKAIEWGWDGKNPSNGIKKFKEKSRDRFIEHQEMPFLLDALKEEENETAKDYIFMSLLTGARKTNVLTMKWEEIHWEREEWRIPETKNGDPLTLPLTRKAIDILKKRKISSNSEWVFANDEADDYYKDPRKAWERVRKRATIAIWKQDPNLAQLVDDVETEVKSQDNYACTVLRIFNAVKREAKKRKIALPQGLMDVRLHDIRRTFGSYQAMNGVSLEIIGKTLGHKSQQATQVYARLQQDTIRKSIDDAVNIIEQLENK
ncbi:MAG: tyrosine-type recombinase/integrase [Alphaproteobacteria bacterium]